MCKSDNESMLLAAQTDRQDVNCDWWKEGGKQEAFPCELVVSVFPC